MADFSCQSLTDGYFEYQGSDIQEVACNYSQFALEGGGGSSTIEYYMRGKDVDCGILTYRYWVSLNSPDINGSGYSGTKCGGSALTDIVINSIKIRNS